MSDALYWLTLTALTTALFAVPYVIERILRVGPWLPLSYTNRGIAGFDQPDENPAHWARRAHAAHRNSIESLPVFAALVLIAQAAGMADAFVAAAAQIYFWARLAFYGVYVAGIPVVRTLLFFVGLGAIFAIAFHVLGYL